MLSNEILPMLTALQWFAALLLVPLACWQFAANHANLCRAVAVLSGYVVQFGFFLLLHDAGFDPRLLLLFASLAGYFWVSSTLSFLPVRARPSAHSADFKSTQVITK